MKTLYVKNRDAWRQWLVKNSASCREVWLVHYNKNSGQVSISYEDSVEEALCFGWIDGKIQNIDEQRYARRFTPRKPDSPWSASNIQRVKRVKAAGKTMPAGLAAFHPERRRDAALMPEQLPEDLKRAFKKNTEVWENFQAFPPYHRRVTSAWVASAKKEETRIKRLGKLIVFSARNERIQFM